MRKFSKPEEEAEINMTPMLDIVFIMLIFFIVTASFVKEQGLDIQQPPEAPEQEPDPDKQNIIIRVDNNNQVWIWNDRRRVDIRQVRPNIERLHAKYPDGVVVIQAAPDAKTGVIVQIYDQALVVDRRMGVSVTRYEP
jgi:biopolymer transport protein ExbD